ncbi:hypothetical protein PCE1_001544 [Barthelona sp. PCE]
MLNQSRVPPSQDRLIPNEEAKKSKKAVKQHLFQQLAITIAVLLAFVVWGFAINSENTSSSPVPSSEVEIKEDMDLIKDLFHIPHVFTSPEWNRVQNELLNMTQSLQSNAQWDYAVTFQTADNITHFHLPGKFAYTSNYLAVNVSNIIVTMCPKGLTGEKRYVGVNAHYDSSGYAPGTADDGVHILSIIRAAEWLLTQDSADYKRCFLGLLNGNEEEGLLGAQAFMAHDLASKTDMFLNLESGASRGEVMSIFRASNKASNFFLKTKPGDFKYVPLTADIFNKGLVPSGTDAAVFESFGLEFLDAAQLHGRYDYHTPNDDFNEFSEGLFYNSIHCVKKFTIGAMKYTADDEMFTDDASQIINFGFIRIPMPTWLTAVILLVLGAYVIYLETVDAGCIPKMLSMVVFRPLGQFVVFLFLMLVYSFILGMLGPYRWVNGAAYLFPTALYACFLLWVFGPFDVILLVFYILFLTMGMYVHNFFFALFLMLVGRIVLLKIPKWRYAFALVFCLIQCFQINFFVDLMTQVFYSSLNAQGSPELIVQLAVAIFSLFFGSVFLLLSDNMVDKKRKWDAKDFVKRIMDSKILWITAHVLLLVVIIIGHVNVDVAPFTDANAVKAHLSLVLEDGNSRLFFVEPTATDFKFCDAMEGYERCKYPMAMYGEVDGCCKPLPGFPITVQRPNITVNRVTTGDNVNVSVSMISDAWKMSVRVFTEDGVLTHNSACNCTYSELPTQADFKINTYPGEQFEFYATFDNVPASTSITVEVFASYFNIPTELQNEVDALPRGVEPFMKASRHGPMVSHHELTV